MVGKENWRKNTLECKNTKIALIALMKSKNNIKGSQIYIDNDLNPKEERCK